MRLGGQSSGWTDSNNNRKQQLMLLRQLKDKMDSSLEPVQEQQVEKGQDSAHQKRTQASDPASTPTTSATRSTTTRSTSSTSTPPTSLMTADVLVDVNLKKMEFLNMLRQMMISNLTLKASIKQDVLHGNKTPPMSSTHPPRTRLTLTSSDNLRKQNRIATAFEPSVTFRPTVTEALPKATTTMINSGISTKATSRTQKKTELLLKLKKMFIHNMTTESSRRMTRTQQVTTKLGILTTQMSSLVTTVPTGSTPRQNAVQDIIPTVSGHAPVMPVKNNRNSFVLSKPSGFNFANFHTLTPLSWLYEKNLLPRSHSADPGFPIPHRNGNVVTSFKPVSENNKRGSDLNVLDSISLRNNPHVLGSILLANPRDFILPASKDVGADYSSVSVTRRSTSLTVAKESGPASVPAMSIPISTVIPSTALDLGNTSAESLAAPASFETRSIASTSTASTTSSTVTTDHYNNTCNYNYYTNNYNYYTNHFNSYNYYTDHYNSHNYHTDHFNNSYNYHTDHYNNSYNYYTDHYNSYYYHTDHYNSYNYHTYHYNSYNYNTDHYNYYTNNNYNYDINHYNPYNYNTDHYNSHNYHTDHFNNSYNYHTDHYNNSYNYNTDHYNNSYNYYINHYNSYNYNTDHYNSYNYNTDHYNYYTNNNYSYDTNHNTSYNYYTDHFNDSYNCYTDHYYSYNYYTDHCNSYNYNTDHYNYYTNNFNYYTNHYNPYNYYTDHYNSHNYYLRTAIIYSHYHDNDHSNNTHNNNNNDSIDNNNNNNNNNLNNHIYDSSDDKNHTNNHIILILSTRSNCRVWPQDAVLWRGQARPSVDHVSVSLFSRRKL
ncbi:GATA zinc finger domain-containing protein 14-like [Haliotis rufescens]|uniref:GATA zinc finger domain-containing protein 14-like n=1 Tax=Haliotis rufescens TaxID=6454 RepID=UPI00201F8E7D|nr:GATA zinc finger domain-containing protein 14-like [Haliotis rufescens]